MWLIFLNDLEFDELVKSPKMRLSVIPAKAGIQSFQIVKNSLDSGFHRSDDFLRDHQSIVVNFFERPGVSSFRKFGLHIIVKNNSMA